MPADDTSVAPTCVNHPEVRTSLSCSTCGDPICPRCMVATAVGQKCPACARLPGRASGRPDPVLLARGFGVGLAVAAVGALVMFQLGFGAILVAALFGFLVAEAVRRAARRRFHPQLGMAAATAVVAATLAVGVALGLDVLHPAVFLRAGIAAALAYLRAAGTF